MARPGRRAARRPELGVPAPIFTLKAAIIPWRAHRAETETPGTDLNKLATGQGGE
jgi:hypothetical protein